jgi:hypothetical protein
MRTSIASSTIAPAPASKDFLKRFSSGGGGGQPIKQDDTRRKLELIMEVSQEIWGNT